MATANKNLSNYDKNTIPNAKNFRFGIVISEWNDRITEGLYSGVIEALTDCGALHKNIIRWNVPGSFELIYGAKKMIETQKPDVVITIGCVIKGETMHFEFVCEGVTQGIKDLNVLSDIPTIFCLLTDNTEQQSIDRSGGIHGNKGTEAAIAAIKMAYLREQANLGFHQSDKLLKTNQLQIEGLPLKIQE
ncbi:6,7-dimethyl-8-ribityllumazine synthase [Flavobacterium psychrophilum]|jgi:6,7-dimethyl-8-ribityllumazine synthase|uniref:6,7-dimethyl-8-ribityllumazine synthase n=1 Tax=Flavobacterium psychrophilum TaxID=96345 RepID=A0A7U2NH18_FLAPS|nr:6,7-dimethyl-8-ribityllumazine synthase [Flavobacterium psychrophilum]EKT3966263.1 6,7-dimethyl-8-ribityllumazine synthase [Flavobacterium psychrophilum]ELY1977911.1 6,7-dimethyl-8-ribityllumazine synthase [Flavobacterium psychrophilum]ELY2017522.1 6,7-dimethyl-8-ribityllumazine synthase [Flavobacterium psychrophilum]OAE92653.1 6,7-dimethyl-8-ribityllumazine synthase [Flavobacterium psychrophilum]OJH11852.1 6,7-dimethyl-8-ribityllumazine synthase [Flavobacterium psychrophilum]